MYYGANIRKSNNETATFTISVPILLATVKGTIAVCRSSVWFLMNHNVAPSTMELKTTTGAKIAQTEYLSSM